MGPMLAPLDCTLNPGSVQTLRDLTQSATDAEFDEPLGVLADEQPRFFTTYPTPNGQVGEIFTIGNGGTPASWSLGANGFLDARPIAPDYAGVLMMRAPGGAPTELVYMVIEANDDQGMNVSEQVLATAPAGTYFDDGRLFRAPMGGLADVFAVYSRNDPNEAYFLPPLASGGSEQVLLANDVNLSESDYSPTAFVRIGATNHIWVGDFGDDPTRYYGFDGVTVPAAPPISMAADTHVVDVALTDDDRLRVAGIILDEGTATGSVYVGVVEESDLQSLDIADLPVGYSLTSFNDAATRGNFEWSGSHAIWSGRHEGGKTELKLVIMHETGALRFEGTFEVPAPLPNFLQITGVYALPNPFFSVIAGDIHLAWSETINNGGALVERLRYGVVTCATVE